MGVNDRCERKIYFAGNINRHGIDKECDSRIESSLANIRKDVCVILDEYNNDIDVKLSGDIITSQEGKCYLKDIWFFFVMSYLTNIFQERIF